VAVRKSIPFDRDRYVSYHLLKLANGMSRSASRVFLALFGVGIIEWRILSILAVDSYVTAQTLSERIALDRGAASRSIRELEQLRLVKVANSVTDNRKRPITITPKGYALFQKLATIIVKRQQLLLGGLSELQVNQLLETFNRMEQNLTTVHAFDDGLIQEQGQKRTASGRRARKLRDQKLPWSRSV
jgi:DNA-binding MarR family transcriptional regulator